MKPTPTPLPRPLPGVLPHDRDLVQLLSGATTESGKNLLALLDERPILLVFLRHFGDPFTREAIHDVAQATPSLDRRQVRPVFVHMGSPDRARPFFRRFGIPDVERVSDPSMRLYRAHVFNLLKSTVLPHFFGATAYWKMVKRPLWRYGVGSPGKEDPTQLPGIFFLRDRAIYRAFRHKNLGERPDYTLFGV